MNLPADLALPAALAWAAAATRLAVASVAARRRPAGGNEVSVVPDHTAGLADFQRLLLRLAAASTLNQVADVWFTDGRAMFAADVAGLATRTTDGRAIQVVGWNPAWTAASRLVSLDRAGIVAEVILFSNPVWSPARSGAEPANPFAGPGDGGRPFAIVPLRAHSATIGALSLAWRAERTLTADERALMESLGRHFGAAVERALRYESEQRQRVEAESSRAEALRLRDELSAVLKAIPEPVFVAAADGTITLRNASAAELLEHVPTLEALRKRLPSVPPAPDAEADAEAGRPVVRHPERGRLYELGEYATERGGSRIVMLRDVTDEQRAREAREAFIGVLSHELRTPVTTILGGIDMLARGLPAEVADEVLGDVKFEAERLRRLIEDLLILSRFERRALEVGAEPVLAQRILPGIAQREAGRHTPPAKIRIELPQDLPPVHADPTYLDQVLRNLIGNAVKYGADFGPIDVSAEPFPNAVRIRVADRGPGFPAEDAERLFELFYRASGTAAKPGAGIGLFAARQLARTMGGDLVASPRRPAGAEFVLTLRVVDPDDGGDDGLLSRVERRATARSA
jgi:signal transduction histidine kinase